ncbi:PREDICTED: venom allergen 3-like [Wasmannia auropunctata]|uniref:venom allergen 3-like n=1 Tax=Wasmannia auropunctata TaxID=64793 RepID=UPI0005EFC8A2|nr:PREDICTED: venom allergen 3-like [Wasmannia auropunctata]
MALIFNTLCLAIVVEILAGTSATDYCNIESCKEMGKVHTMCKYTLSTPAAACKQWSNQSLNDAERKIMKDGINQIRNQLTSVVKKRVKDPQRIAIHMLDLSWDEELETIAQRWTNQCIKHYDDCRNVERFEVTQYMAWKSSMNGNEVTLEDLMETAYNNLIEVGRRYFSAYPDIVHTIEDFTHNLWANMAKVGCGRIKFKEPNDLTTHLIVCNFAPRKI